MARPTLEVRIELDRIHCYEEADGWGDAEPYLWTVFFKIDGASVLVTDTLALSGQPVVVYTPGSHGNLGTRDVDVGDNVYVPEAIGVWETTLGPIPVPEWLQQQYSVDDVAGIIGVVCVLMEEDNVTDDGARAGHIALNEAVKSALEQVVARRSFLNTDISQEELDAFKDEMKFAVKEAVKSQQNHFENLWSWLNEDDMIGTKTFFWDQDQLESQNIIHFDKRWKRYGDWKIFGHVNASMLCPARSVATLASALIGQKVEYDDELIRKFRDSQFRKMPRLNEWWQLAERHVALLAYGVAEDKDVREAAVSLLLNTGSLVANKDGVVTDEYLDSAHRILKWMSNRKSRRARIDVTLPRN